MASSLEPKQRLALLALSDFPSSPRMCGGIFRVYYLLNEREGVSEFTTSIKIPINSKSCIVFALRMIPWRLPSFPRSPTPRSLPASSHQLGSILPNYCTRRTEDPVRRSITFSSLETPARRQALTPRYKRGVSRMVG